MKKKLTSKLMLKIVSVIVAFLFWLVNIPVFVGFNVLAVYH